MAESPGSQAGNVLEGLLCPICLLDLKTINQLQEHFEVAHGAEDQDVFQTLKGFFGKAKRKILKQEAELEGSNRVFEETNILSDTAYQLYDYELSSQEIGRTVSHTLTFKGMRENKINTYIIETNKLLIRLDKLISEAPEDPEKRKAHEKSVVPWVADADVRLCPGCGKSFGLSRRRHHCRLCGAVMCQTCSQFIDFTFARTLTQPIVQDDHHQLALPLFSPSQRRGSNTSLLSVVNFAGEPHIRVCRDCKALLVRRKRQLEDHGQKAIIVQKYERMREYIAEIEKLEPLYVKMIESLCEGETQYHMRDVQELKIKISKMAEGIDAISKHIAKLESPDEESSSTKALQLQSSIRVAASQFVRNTVVNMPQIPTEQEISRYRRLREEKIQRQIQLEKEAEIQTPSKVPSTPRSLNTNTAKSLNSNHTTESKTQVSPDSGWSASPGNFVEEENPMLQQINIIRKYIKQARLDHKYDEVVMLEANLKELQEEYLKQQTPS